MGRNPFNMRHWQVFIFLLLHLSIQAVVVSATLEGSQLSSADGKQIKEVSTRTEGNKKITRIVYAGGEKKAVTVGEPTLVVKKSGSTTVNENKEKVKQLISRRFRKKSKGGASSTFQEEMAELEKTSSSQLAKEAVHDLVPASVRHRLGGSAVKLKSLKRKLPGKSELKEKYYKFLRGGYKTRLDLGSQQVSKLKSKALFANNKLKSGALAAKLMGYNTLSRINTAKSNLLNKDFNFRRTADRIAGKMPDSVALLKDKIDYEGKKIWYSDFELGNSLKKLKGKVPRRMQGLGHRLKASLGGDLSLQLALNRIKGKVPNGMKGLSNKLKSGVSASLRSDLNLRDTLKSFNGKIPAGLKDLRYTVPQWKSGLANYKVNVGKTASKLKGKLPRLPESWRLYTDYYVPGKLREAGRRLSTTSLGRSWKSFKRSTPDQVKQYLKERKKMLKLRGKSLLYGDYSVAGISGRVKKNLPPSVTYNYGKMRGKLFEKKERLLSKKVNVGTSFKTLRNGLPKELRGDLDYYVPRGVASMRMGLRRLNRKTVNVDKLKRKLRQRLPEDLSHYYYVTLPAEMRALSKKQINLDAYYNRVKSVLPELKSPSQMQAVRYLASLRDRDFHLRRLNLETDSYYNRLLSVKRRIAAEAEKYRAVNTSSLQGRKLHQSTKEFQVQGGGYNHQYRKTTHYRKEFNTSPAHSFHQPPPFQTFHHAPPPPLHTFHSRHFG